MAWTSEERRKLLVRALNWAILLVAAGVVIYLVWYSPSRTCWLLLLTALVALFIAAITAQPQTQNLLPEEIELSDWSNSAASVASLCAIYGRVEGVAKSAIEWYWRNKGPKRAWGRALRVGAIVLVAAAGFVPLLQGIFEERLEEAKSIWRSPTWAAVALALAGLLVLLDQFLGSTSAWIRFVAAANDLQRLLRQFQIDWQIDQANWTTPGAPTSAEANASLVRFKAFVGQVDEIVQQETNVWIAEFRSALRMIEESTKAKTEGGTGSANVKVVAENNAPTRWKVYVDGAMLEECTAPKAFPSLAAGQHAFKAVELPAQGAAGPAREGVKHAIVVAGTTIDVEIKIA